MQLTGKQIVEAGIITNYCEEGVQQQGVDVRIDAIAVVYGAGVIPAEGKTQKCPTQVVNPVENLNTPGEFYNLQPGYYEVTLKEACNIPNNAVLDYKTRSSLVRCGATVYSGQFDAGFNTEQMGCFLEVRKSIRIQRGARIAQAVVNESYPVSDENLYNGQWQNDQQREEKPKRKTTRKKKTNEETVEQDNPVE